MRPLVPIALVAALGLCGCAVSPEEEIRSTLDRLAGRVEARDVDSLRDFVSEAYRDDEGRDRGAVLALGAAYMRSSGRLYVAHRVERIEIAGGRARVSLLAATADVPFAWKELTRVRADVLRFDLELALEGGRWLLIAARWESVSPAEFLLTRYGRRGGSIAILRGDP